MKLNNEIDKSAYLKQGLTPTPNIPLKYGFDKRVNEINSQSTASRTNRINN